MTAAAVAWAFVAAAVVCWPGRTELQGRVRGADDNRPRRRHRRRSSRLGVSRTGVASGHPERLAAVLAVAVVGVAVAVLGLSALPVAILAAPGAARAVARARERGEVAHDPALPLALDLAAAALRSGQPLSHALRLAAPVAGAATAAALTRVAGLLELGTDATIAWAGIEVATLQPVAAAGRRSADSGVRLAAGFEQVAGDLRRAARADAVARAERAGVLAMAPLGLCFLPAFLCLGVVPVVIGIAGHAFGAFD